MGYSSQQDAHGLEHACVAKATGNAQWDAQIVGCRRMRVKHGEARWFTRWGKGGGGFPFRPKKCGEWGTLQKDAWGRGALGSPPCSLTSQVLACGVVLVMNPLGGWGVEVGLGGGKAQGVIAGPHCQADVEGVRGDDAILVHQSPCGQLQERSEVSMSWAAGAETSPAQSAQPCDHPPD